MSRMTRRILEEIHQRNTTVIDFTDIVNEYRKSIEQAQKTGWRIRIERSDLPKVEKPSPPTTSKLTKEEQIIQLMNTLIKKMVPMIEDRGQLDIT
jgi:hypothetical protein